MLSTVAQIRAVVNLLIVTKNDPPTVESHAWGNALAEFVAEQMRVLGDAQRACPDWLRDVGFEFQNSAFGWQLTDGDRSLIVRPNENRIFLYRGRKMMELPCSAELTRQEVLSLCASLKFPLQISCDRRVSD